MNITKIKSMNCPFNKLLLLTGFVITQFLQASGQVTAITKHIYNPNGSVWRIDVAELPNDRFLVLLGCYDTSSTHAEYTLLKINSEGTILNQKLFSGYVKPITPHIVVTSDGSVGISGVFSSDYALIKLDSNLNVLWGVDLPTVDNSYNDLITNQRGNYVIYGCCSPVNTNINGLVLMEIDNQGNLIHEQILENTGLGVYTGQLIPYKQNGYLYNHRIGILNGANLHELDSTLNYLNPSYQYYGSSAGWETQVTGFNSDDGSFMQICKAKLTNGKYAIGVLKVDSNLNVLWAKQLYYPNNFAFMTTKHIFYTSDNCFLLSTEGADSTSSGYNNKNCLIKIDTSGNVLWSYMYGDTTYRQFDGFNKTFEMSDGYMSFGRIKYTYSPSTNPTYKLWMMKTHFDGTTACQYISIPMTDSIAYLFHGGSSTSLRNLPQILPQTVTTGTDTLIEEVECITLNSETQINKNQFKIFPNPVTDRLTIESRNYISKSCTANIFNTYGHLVLSKKISSSTESIPLSLSPGMYVLSLTHDNMCEYHKFIVK